MTSAIGIFWPPLCVLVVLERFVEISPFFVFFFFLFFFLLLLFFSTKYRSTLSLEEKTSFPIFFFSHSKAEQQTKQKKNRTKDHYRPNNWNVRKKIVSVSIPQCRSCLVKQRICNNRTSVVLLHSLVLKENVLSAAANPFSKTRDWKVCQQMLASAASRSGLPQRS